MDWNALMASDGWWGLLFKLVVVVGAWHVGKFAWNVLREAVTNIIDEYHKPRGIKRSL